MVERRTVNPYVAGSSPAGGAKFKEAASLDAAFYVIKRLVCIKPMSQSWPPAF
ncbi:hypothetical protein VCHA53O466_10384 [Vibrio chagasii]|nr:hypothetical protein VCHA53O466_10384 [Vibrio chagasii]